MIRGFGTSLGRHVPSRAALVTLLMFAYGATVLIFPLLLGGTSGVTAALALQTLSIPVLIAAAWITAARRPSLVPAFALAPVLGVAVSGGVVATSWNPHLVAVRMAFVLFLSVAGFTFSWAVLGYVAGTAWQWRGRDRVPRRELGAACTVVLATSALVIVSYALFWGHFVIGLGDVV